MNPSQKLGLFILILITVVYIYFSFFNQNNVNFELPKHSESNQNITENPDTIDNEEYPIENTDKEKSYKTVKIYITDSNGKLRSVNRKCDLEKEKSCFNFAINELVSAPTKWEKSKGFTSEIPQGTKILSIREGEGSIKIDLSSVFEAGGGAESTYTRVMQIIKTARANTSQPVYLYVNGIQADVIGGEGIMVKQPLNERSLDD